MLNTRCPMPLPDALTPCNPMLLTRCRIFLDLVIDGQRPQDRAPGEGCCVWRHAHRRSHHRCEEIKSKTRKHRREVHSLHHCYFLLPWLLLLLGWVLGVGVVGVVIAVVLLLLQQYFCCYWEVVLCGYLYIPSARVFVYFLGGSTLSARWPFFGPFPTCNIIPRPPPPAPPLIAPLLPLAGSCILLGACRQWAARDWCRMGPRNNVGRDGCGVAQKGARTAGGPPHGENKKSVYCCT